LLDKKNWEAQIQIMKNASPKKMVLWISIGIMSLIWLVLSAILTLLSLEAFAMLLTFNLFLIVFVAFLFAAVVLLIPLQMIRYVRELRALR
jgi:hypothetical protein